MASSNIQPPYVLQELPDITDCINYPIKNVQRIKYTCFDVSKSLIAFGATSGGIYIFNRSPCEFLQLIPSKDGAITRVSISTDEKHIAFVNGRGIITIMKCKESLMGGHSAVTSKEHQGNEVSALIWSSYNTLFAGDDVGRISVLQLQSFIAKTMFQSSSQIIMSLDSRVCQLDVRDCMLLVSTQTRCYICDTSQEQYRQIGQKLRDGEFGACFVTKEKGSDNSSENRNDFKEIKEYNIVKDDEKFAIGQDLQNTFIYAARPSSRLWEASIDGTVQRTHQFKEVLARKAKKIITVDDYDKELLSLDSPETEGEETEGRSINFPKIYSLGNDILSFKKDALYFLDIQDDENTVWFDFYKNIVDCKVHQDYVYLWLANGSLANLRFMKVEQFLMKCYIDEKYMLCGELCDIYSNYLLSKSFSPKLHILAGLKEKLKEKEVLENIEKVIDMFENLKSTDATQMKSGIYVVDNTYSAQTSLNDSNDKKVTNENKFGALPPEALQTLKDLSVSVTDKFSSSKKILKEKWEEMKQLSTETPNPPEITIPKRIPREEPCEQILAEFDNNVIYKESSQKAIEIDDGNLNTDRVCKSLYQYYRLSVVGKEMENSLTSLIEDYACDINQIYELMLLLEHYCLSVGDLEDSKYIPNYIFLSYLEKSQKELLQQIIDDDVLYKYFVDSCIAVNVKKIYNLGCECGFPLPFSSTNQPPVFSELIDEFIEKQWSSQSRQQCYDVCKRMPYLWKKILYLRRNEDLLNVLRILLQMLDENLLHSFLPQFTLDTWDRTIQLYATLHANMCLNCNRTFDNISVKETLSWNDLGALMIKSVGGKNAIKVMEKHASLIETGELSMIFYHTSILASLFEKIDGSIIGQLTDALFSCYEFEDSRSEICSLLQNSLHGQIKYTALPLMVAAKTVHWGLSPLLEKAESETEPLRVKNVCIKEIIDNLFIITNRVTDCTLCGLPLQNPVLIKDGGLWVFKCGHTFHGACLNLNKVRLCPSCIIA